jgi:phi13 family phage major tail protein
MRIGLKQLIIAPLLTDVKGGASTWDTPITMQCIAIATLTPVGSMEKFYGDNAICDLAESYVGEDAGLQVSDITPEHYAMLMGHTYSAGGVLKIAGDNSPYFAVGYKVNKSDGKEIYRWLFKVKFKKAKNDAATLKESPEFKPYDLEGAAIPLLSNNQIEYSLSNSDPAYNTSQWANFFTAVTTLTTDNTALTATIAKGTAGDAGKILITFAKGSSASFSLVAALITATTIQVIDAVGIRAGTFAVGGAGTTVVVKFTPSVAFATETIATSVSNDIKDNSGVAATPTGITLTYA